MRSPSSDRKFDRSLIAPERFFRTSCISTKRRCNVENTAQQRPGNEACNNLIGMYNFCTQTKLQISGTVLWSFNEGFVCAFVDRDYKFHTNEKTVATNTIFTVTKKVLRNEHCKKYSSAKFVCCILSSACVFWCNTQSYDLHICRFSCPGEPIVGCRLHDGHIRDISLGDTKFYPQELSMPYFM